MSTLSKEQYWYHQPWAWMILSLLLVAIFASILMVVTALKHTPAELDAVWYDKGILSSKTKAQPSLARIVNLHGNLNYSADGTVIFQLQKEPHDLSSMEIKLINPPELLLVLEHPTDPAQDYKIVLTQEKNGIYAGHLEHTLRGKRYLVITPHEKQWSLTSVGYFPLNKLLAFSLN